MSEFTVNLTGAGGLAPHFYGDSNYTSSTPNLRYIANDDQVVEGIYNPFKRNGYLAPANISTRDVKDNGSGFFRTNSVSLFDAAAAQFYVAGKIQLAYGGPSDTSLSSTSGAIVNSNQGYQDLELYTVNGVRHLYALYIDSSNRQNIAVIDLTAGHTWKGSNLVGAGGTITNNKALSKFATKMIAADNGYLYLLNQNSIEQIDGTTVGGAAGTLSSPAPILFPPTAYMSDGIDYGGNLYIGLHLAPIDGYGPVVQGNEYSYPCGVYIWDRQSTVFGRQSFIVIPQARFIRKLFISSAGNVRCIATLVNGETGILEYNGHAFKTLMVLGQTAFPAYIDSAQVGQGGIWWQSSDGNLYFYGSPSPEMNEGLFCLGTMSTGSYNGDVILISSSFSEYTGTTPGHISIPEAFFRAYFAGSSYFLKKWYLNADSDATNLITITAQAGNVFTPIQYLPKLATLKNIRIYCIPNGAAGDTTPVATLSFYANQSGTPYKTVTVTRNDISKGYLQYEINKPYATAFQMKITWDTDQPVSSNDFNPSFATVAYDPTTTIR